MSSSEYPRIDEKENPYEGAEDMNTRALQGWHREEAPEIVLSKETGEKYVVRDRVVIDGKTHLVASLASAKGAAWGMKTFAENEVKHPKRAKLTELQEHDEARRLIGLVSEMPERPGSEASTFPLPEVLRKAFRMKKGTVITGPSTNKSLHPEDQAGFIMKEPDGRWKRCSNNTALEVLRKESLMTRVKNGEFQGTSSLTLGAAQSR